MDSLNIDGTWVYVGSLIEFQYNDKKRIGTVERMGISTDRHSAKSVFIQLNTDEGVRNFTVDKIQGKVMRNA